ncbi:MAG: EamA family transporter RarD [Actinomycetota bacterium]|nr:EamA family transporter RarD [Actinomycetota bacterium]
MTGQPQPRARDHPEAGLVVGVAAYILWGFLTVYWHELDHFDAFELIGWRVIFSAVTMVVVLSATGRWRFVLPVFRNRALLVRVALTAALLTINWTSYVYAVVHDRVIETALGYFIAPIGTMLAGVFLLGERIRRAQIVSIGFAVAAVVVLTISYGRIPYLALAIAVSWTCYGFLKKQVPLNPIDGMAAEVFLLVIPAIVVVAAMAGRSSSIPSSGNGKELFLLLFSGLVTLLPLTMFAFAAQRVPLTILGPVQYSVPTINLLLGWLAYHEALPLSRVIGFALVWVGLVVLTFESVHRARRSRSRQEAMSTAGLAQEPVP